MLNIKSLVEKYLVTEDNNIDNKYSYFGELYRNEIQQHQQHYEKNKKSDNNLNNVDNKLVIPFKQINGSNYQNFNYILNKLPVDSLSDDIKSIIEQWQKITIVLNYKFIYDKDDLNAKSDFYEHFYKFINFNKDYENFMKNLKNTNEPEWERHYSDILEQLNDFYTFKPEYFYLNTDDINKKLKNIFKSEKNHSIETLDINDLNKPDAYKSHSNKTNLNTSNEDNKIRDKVDITHVYDNNLKQSEEDIVYEKFPKDIWNTEVLTIKKYANGHYYAIIRRLKEPKNTKQVTHFAVYGPNDR